MKPRTAVHVFALVVFTPALVTGCATSSQDSSSEPRYTIVKNPEATATMGGIPPDQMAEIQLTLQNREPSTLKCYQDVLDEKHDRKFQGNVKVLITIQPAGESSRASAVKVANTTLNNAEVEGCLVDRIKEFDFPKVSQGGEVTYEYQFRPAY